MQNLKITIMQTDLFWESHSRNRQMLYNKINALKESTDIIILPEMFPTAFSMAPSPIAEPVFGESFQWMKETAKNKGAVIAGSIPTEDKGKYYNRFYWVQPNGEFYQYDKKHLFTFAGEHNEYTPGETKTIINYKGWKLLPLVCYDLRFPVWSKNNFNEKTGFDYDCLIYVANWPKTRSKAWKTLLMARAIENQCYVIGVNRVGKDNNNNEYSGDSAVINAKGEMLSNIKPDEETNETSVISYEELITFRQSFKLGPDWDKFTINK